MTEDQIEMLDKIADIVRISVQAGIESGNERAEVALETLNEARKEIERLRRDCAELYQVIGTMSEHCPDPCDPAIVKALDNASDAANGDPRRHDDLLPFILPEPMPRSVEDTEGWDRIAYDKMRAENK